MMEKAAKKVTKVMRRLPGGKGPPLWRTFSLHNPVLRILYILLIVGGLVLLLGPRLGDQELPRAGIIAQHNYEATVDFTFERENPDVETLRRAAAEQVLPIYRYLPERRDKNVELIESAFGMAQPVVRQHWDTVELLKAQLVSELSLLEERKAAVVAEQAAAVLLREEYEAAEKKWKEEERQRLLREQHEKKNGKEKDASGDVAAPVPATPEPVPPPDRDFAAELAQIDKESEAATAANEKQLAAESKRYDDELVDLQFRFQQMLDLGPTFDTEDFQVLAQNGFTDDVERVLRQVVKGVMEKRIVRTRYQLEDRLRKGVRDPLQQTIFTMDDLDLFVELDEARSMAVERARNAFADETARTGSARGEGTFTPRLQNVILEIAAAMIDENYVYDPRATQEEIERARRSIEPVTRIGYQKGQTLIPRGERVSPEDVSVLKAMVVAERRSNRLLVLAGVFLFVVVMLGFAYTFSRRDMRKMLRSERDIALFGLVLLSEVAVVKLFAMVMDGVLTVWENVTEIAFYLAIPFAMGAMVIRLFLNVEAAVLFSVLASLLTGVLFQDRIVAGHETTFPQIIVMYTLITSLAGTYAMQDIRQRTSLLRAGFFVGSVNVVVIVAMYLIDGGRFEGGLVSTLISGLVSGVLDYFLVLALAPALEYMFGYTSDIKLLELANITQPALKDLSMKAPGTYHHSVMVGNLAEAAAESIGANPLMTRVGAYYHDLGKMRNPRYFAENQAGENPHDKLKPQMSALIIKSHVKDGIEIARSHRLPQDISDFIPQHHGTALISYFYARAKEAVQPGMEDVDEADYRYPGPKPQRRETALVMLADGVEAAVRSLPEPTPARIKGLVKKITNGKFIDGQLDECELTLKDLHEIGRSFTRILVSMYHARPEYPKIPGEEERQKARGGSELPTLADAPGAGASRKKPRKGTEDADASRAEQSPTEDKGEHGAAAAAGVVAPPANRPR